MLLLDSQVRQVSAAGLLIFFPKIATAKIVEADSCVTRVRIDEIRLATNYNHK